MSLEFEPGMHAPHLIAVVRTDCGRSVAVGLVADGLYADAGRTKLSADELRQIAGYMDCMADPGTAQGDAGDIPGE